jgi:hypothetical protein
MICCFSRKCSGRRTRDLWMRGLFLETHQLLKCRLPGNAWIPDRVYCCLTRLRRLFLDCGSSRFRITRFRLGNQLLPSLEGEHFLAFPEAGEIEAAVFAPPFPGAETDLESHPEGRIGVSLPGPPVEVHAPANRALRITQIGPHDCGSEKAFFAVQASQWRFEAQNAELLRKVPRPRRPKIPASTLGAGC